MSNDGTTAPAAPAAPTEAEPGPAEPAADANEPLAYWAQPVDVSAAWGPRAEPEPTGTDVAIDALRAATTAADARSPQLALDRVAEIRRLHEVTIDAERRARRFLATPGARRRLHDARMEESDALHMLGFATFDEFAETHTSMQAEPGTMTRREDQTIARIREQLTDLGVDPGDDPLEAARVFLGAHEAAEVAEVTEPEGVVAGVVTPDETDVDNTDQVGTTATEPDAMLDDDAAPVPEAAAPDVELELEPEPDAPWVPAAQLPAKAEPEAGGHDDDVVDRWINAEARAERMHAEVDRAQAELVALLARSADLEQTVEARADEVDTVHAELASTRLRVEELEQSITRSDAERDELDRALATSRARVSELEDIVADRERAAAQAATERESALEQVAELEATLAARTAELEQARTTVSELEGDLTTQAAQLDLARGEAGTARATADELGAELETTRRSLDALDAHAEAIEAELADARRRADSPETRRELEAVRQELATARFELGELEARRTETDGVLTRDRAELEQLRHELATTREATDAIREELSEARLAADATAAQVEAAEQARAAITIDAAELLARAEADATNLLERANRDAEAIRQEALLSSGVLTAGAVRASDGEAITNLVAQVSKLERKLAKQRRRLDKLARTEPATTAPTAAAARPPASPLAADIIDAAEREAMEIRRAARRDREQFRDELLGLLSRLAAADD